MKEKFEKFRNSKFWQIFLKVYLWFSVVFEFVVAVLLIIGCCTPTVKMALASDVQPQHSFTYSYFKSSDRFGTWRYDYPSTSYPEEPYGVLGYSPVDDDGNPNEGIYESIVVNVPEYTSGGAGYVRGANTTAFSFYTDSKKFYVVDPEYIDPLFYVTPYLGWSLGSTGGLSYIYFWPFYQVSFPNDEFFYMADLSFWDHFSINNVNYAGGASIWGWSSRYNPISATTDNRYSPVVFGIQDNLIVSNSGAYLSKSPFSYSMNTGGSSRKVFYTLYEGGVPMSNVGVGISSMGVPWAAQTSYSFAFTYWPMGSVFKFDDPVAVSGDFYDDGYSDGYEQGYTFGFSSGEEAGKASASPVTTFSGLISNAVSSVSSFLNLDLFGLSLGTWLFIPVCISLIFLVLRLFNHG